MTKKVVLAFGLEKVQIDPQFCDHHNALFFREVDGDYWQCPDCHARLDEDMEVVRVAGDEIPFMEAD